MTQSCSSSFSTEGRLQSGGHFFRLWLHTRIQDEGMGRNDVERETMAMEERLLAGGWVEACTEEGGKVLRYRGGAGFVGVCAWTEEVILENGNAVLI